MKVVVMNVCENVDHPEVIYQLILNIKYLLLTKW